MAMTTTTPFLGCKISLISKSEIRYEGILYTIDPKESTIALAKVRSFGTEDRPTERQVPPREEVFEYIIFRAGDIKDLIVDDPPASIAPGLADPAIIQAHSTSSPSGATFPSTTFPQMSTTSNISATSGQRSSGPAFSAINSLAFGTTNKSVNSVESRSQNSTPTGGHQRRQSPHERPKQASAPKPTAVKDNQRRNASDRGGHQQQQQQHYRRGSGQQNYQNYSQQQNRRGFGGHGGQGQQMSGYQRQNQNHSQPQQSGNRFGGYNNRQYNHYQSDGRRPPMQSRPQSQRGAQNRGPNRGPKEALKFESDYDFDKAEEEFKQMESKMSSLKIEHNSGSEPTKDDKQAVDAHQSVNDESTNGSKEESEANLDHFYDKEKSFFDTISCEAIEREKGNVQRMDWKSERKLNSETFGVNLHYRRMGFGRGGRGYGYGYRGYSGGYRYNRGGGFGGRGGGGGFGGRGSGGGGGDTRNRMNTSQRVRN